MCKIYFKLFSRFKIIGMFKAFKTFEQPVPIESIRNVEFSEFNDILFKLQS